jgi:WD40 repeat protein
MLNTTFKIYYQNNILQTLLIVTILVSFITPLRGMDSKDKALSKIEIVRKYGLTWYWLSRIISDPKIINKIIRYAKQPLSDEQKEQLMMAIHSDATVPFVELNGKVGDSVFPTLSFDGTMLASSCSYNGNIKLWKTKTYEHIATLAGDPCTRYCSVLFSPDGKMLAAGSMREHITLWSIENIRSRRTNKIYYSTKRVGTYYNFEEEYILSFSPNGKTLLSKSSEGGFAVWDTEKLCHHPWSKNRTNYTKDDVRSIAFSPDSKTIAVGLSNGDIKLENLQTLQCLALLKGHKYTVSSITFNFNGDRLASYCKDKQELKLWNTANFECIMIKKHFYVRDLMLSHDNKTMVIASAQDIILWDTENQRSSRSLAHAPFARCALGLGGNLLLSKVVDVMSGPSIRLWNLTDFNTFYTKLKTNNFTLEENDLLIKFTKERELILKLKREEPNNTLSARAIIEKTRSFMDNRNNKPLTQNQNDKLLALTTINNHKKSAVQTKSRNKNCLCCTVL